MTGEFQDAYGAVLIFLFISIFIVLGVIGLMRYFAGTLLYISIFVTMGSIGACIIYTAQKYSATKATTYLVVMIFLVIMLISILIVIMCFRTRIRFALELIKEASKYEKIFYSTKNINFLYLYKNCIFQSRSFYFFIIYRTTYYINSSHLYTCTLYICWIEVTIDW